MFLPLLHLVADAKLLQPIGDEHETQRIWLSLRIQKMGTQQMSMPMLLERCNKYAPDSHGVKGSPSGAQVCEALGQLVEGLLSASQLGPVPCGQSKFDIGSSLNSCKSMLSEIDVQSTKATHTMPVNMPTVPCTKESFVVGILSGPCSPDKVNHPSKVVSGMVSTITLYPALSRARDENQSLSCKSTSNCHCSKWHEECA